METSTKKRKRTDHDSSKSSKKVALEAPNSKVSIVSSTESSWEPVIASAKGIAMPKGLTFTPFKKQRTNVPIRPGRTNVDATEILLHTDENLKMDYTAQEEEVGESGRLLKHYIGVYDPETDKLEIVEARPMFMSGVVKSRRAAAEAMVANQDQVTARDQRNELGKTFGTKKARKAISSLTENAIGGPEGSSSKLDSASSAVLASMAETTAKIATRDQLQLVADEAKPRPKANTEAERAADVYPIDTLFDLPSIPVKDWLDDLKAKREIKTSSRFVSSRLGKLRLMGDSIDIQKIKVLRYLLSLLDLYNSSVVKGKHGPKQLLDKAKLTEKLKLPIPAIEAVRRKFSENGKMTKHHADLLITNVCVLALIADNFDIDTTYDLREDLKLDLKSMRTYFSEIGAKVGAVPAALASDRKWTKAEAAQHHSAKLRIPLQFPKPKNARKRK